MDHLQRGGRCWPPVTPSAKPTTPKQAGEKSKVAAVQAKRNLETADFLATDGRHPEAFEYLVAAAEEAIRSLLYYYVSVEVMTFDPTRASEIQYWNEGDLFDHEKKYALFAALEMVYGVIDLLSRTIRGSKTAEEALAKMTHLNKSMKSVGSTPEEAGQALNKFVPGVIDVIEGITFWESARQGARYSGETRSGEPVLPAPKEEFERFRPIIGRRVEQLERAMAEPAGDEEIRFARELFRHDRLRRKGSKPPRKGNSDSGPRAQ